MKGSDDVILMYYADLLEQPIPGKMELRLILRRKSPGDLRGYSCRAGPNAAFMSKLTSGPG
jgi:hypothetical protein